MSCVRREEIKKILETVYSVAYHHGTHRMKEASMETIEYPLMELMKKFREGCNNNEKKKEVSG